VFVYWLSIFVREILECCKSTLEKWPIVKLLSQEEEEVGECEEGGLSQREDSGIVSVDPPPALLAPALHRRSAADAAVYSAGSSSSSDGGEVVMMASVQQADVIVHAAAEMTPTREGARRRASADSTDRCV